MKKLLCLMVALMLCMSGVAMAESTPSKTTEDMVRIWIVDVENKLDGVDDLRFFVVTPQTVPDKEVYQKRIDIRDNEVLQLIASETVLDYFGETHNAEGAVVELDEELEIKPEELQVHEFLAIMVTGYNEGYGDVTIVVSFSTPYEKDEKVEVLIGIVNPEDHTDVEWTALEGIGVDVPELDVVGGVQLVVTPELMTAIQNEIGLMTVVSK